MKTIVGIVFFIIAVPAVAAGEWTNDGGPYGGRILAIELFDDSGVLVGTRNAGVFVSRDAGTTWQAANTGLGNLIVNCAAVNRRNSNTAFIGTAGDGIYRTTDLRAGARWTNYSFNLGNRNVHCLAICPGDTNTIFAGTVNGIFKSTTGGGYWSDITHDLTVANVAAIALGGWGADTVYVGVPGTDGGVFKSIDGGDTWIPKNNGLTNPFITQVRVDHANPNVLLAGTSGGGVFKSTNGGDSWTSRNNGLGNLTVRDVWIQSDDPQVFYAGTGGGFYMSANGGGSWSAFTTGLTDTDVHAVATDDGGTVLFGGGYWGGIYRSVGGGPWQQSVQGMANTFISDIDCHPYLDYVIQVSSYGQVFISTDEGATWVDHSTGITSEALTAIAIDQSAPDTVYCGANYGGVYKSTDGGHSWSLMNNGLAAVDVTCLRVTHVNNTPYVYAGTYNYLFRSTDGARSWQQTSNGLTDYHIWTIEIDPVTPTTVYAGTYGGGVFKTTDSGDNWTPINTGLGSVYIAAVAVDPLNPEIVYAGAYYGGGLFKSYDGGANWDLSSVGMENSSVWTIDVNPLDPDHVITGTLDGVFLSVDGGDTWRSFSDGLDVRDTRCVMFHRLLGAGRAFAGTYGGGVYIHDDIVSGIGDLVVERGVPGRCRLFQNFPNPFNPGTTIRYEIKGTRRHPMSAVSFDVYDVQGRRVTSLVRSVQGPGIYEVRWGGEAERGGHVASGVYFGRLQIGGDVQTIKMIAVE